MKKSAVLFLGTFLVASSVHAAKPSCKSLIGDWVNQLGSTLTINYVGSDGQLSGTYTSPSGTSGSAVPMIGWTNHVPPATHTDNNITVVSFSVNWGSYGSVTSWSGACSLKSGIPTIATIWDLVRSNSSYEWDHILTNSDTFTPK